ncbi:MAG: 4Fe-4S dicluster domain-containing protein [Planctomycetota bacterium]
MTGERSDRRRLLLRGGRGALRLALAGAIVGAARGRWGGPPAPRPREAAATGILRPPGALAEPEFLAACLRCTSCADACETDCIRFFAPHEGRVAGTPYILAAERACNLCLRCTQVCPSGALAPLEDIAAVRMGTAVVDERLCVSHDGTGACGACHTICPLKNRALTQGLRNKPTVHAEECVGCGMCEEACIVDDRRAIRVVTGRVWT